MLCYINQYCRARYFPHLSKRKTVDGIWFLILIAYVYTADTCLNLLRCVQVYEPTEFKGKLVSVSLIVCMYVTKCVQSYRNLMTESQQC